MRILVTGRASSGSWKVRGEQLGRAIGALVRPRCMDLRGADIVVWVKRVMKGAPLRGRFWVWDIVDAWPQPEGNAWDDARAVAWLREEIGRHKPNAIVFPTTAMLEDSGWQGPALVLPHHAWPRYHPVARRERVQAVGYEGSHVHLGRWRERLEQACAARRWRFEVNGDMPQCDIGIALRECAGHAPRRWKSNVKLANLQALGIPAICSPERGYLEFGSGSEIYVQTEDELADALDRCASQEFRADAAVRMRAAVPTLTQMAERYKAWLATLSS
jgi:hypothetical protein